MKALSVKQPWAHLLVHGLKTIEVRSWSTNYRGRLTIHASRNVDELAAQRTGLAGLPTGVILGSVELVSVEEFTPESWLLLADEHLSVGCYNSPLYAWRVANPLPLADPIPFPGKMGLFDFDSAQEHDSVSLPSGNLERPA
jgi:hypothetical protein